MFKKIKESPLFLKFKELWADLRMRSIIKLGFWLVFMVLVIVMVKVNSNSYTTSSPKVNDGFSSMKSYDFTYETSDLLISGQAYGDKMVFYMNNHRYYFDNNLYVIDNDKAVLEDFSLDILKVTPSMLNNLISGVDGVKDNDFKRYSVSLDRFINLYDGCTGVDLSKAMSYNVVVTVYGDGLIDKVVIDLSNYMLYKTGISTNYLVNIYYYNVNNVSDFSKDFEKMIGVVR